MNQSECWHCGDARHDTSDCVKSTKSRMEISLNGAAAGRRAGFKTAQSMAAAIVLEHLGLHGEAEKVYRLILALTDK